MKIIYLKYAWVPLLISLIIFYLCCLISFDNIPEVEIEWIIPLDKVVHFLMFFGLSGATAINYIHLKRGRVEMWKLLLGAFLLPILYGGFIEIIQHYFFPLRSGDWADFLADLLGSLTALPVAIVFKNYLIKNRFR
ncbi:MAG TPA: hypothetical protein DIT04_10235 [Dysgonomonas sp.]|nr:hypothetical protein [Dysgonomonas sp.]